VKTLMPITDAIPTKSPALPAFKVVSVLSTMKTKYHPESPDHEDVAMGDRRTGTGFMVT
jgi:hypothetical protein